MGGEVGGEVGGEGTDEGGKGRVKRGVTGDNRLVEVWMNGQNKHHSEGTARNLA